MICRSNWSISVGIESSSMRSREAASSIKIDRFVRQKAVGDVAMRQRGRGDERGILNAHAVMHFVAFLQSAQDGDGRFDGRLR